MCIDIIQQSIFTTLITFVLKRMTFEEKKRSARRWCKCTCKLEYLNDLGKVKMLNEHYLSYVKYVTQQICNVFDNYSPKPK